MGAVKIVACACGLELRGTEAELVPLVQQHGRDVHNMEVTPEQVLAMAVAADGGDQVLVGDMPSAPVGRAELARGDAAAAPETIAAAQVIEHGLRHLAWLVRDDPVVAGRLDGGWRAALDSYVPEPFRHLAPT